MDFKGKKREQEFMHGIKQNMGTRTRWESLILKYVCNKKYQQHIMEVK